MPTFVELSGVTPPKGYETDGHSLLSYFRGEAAPKRDYFYWELHTGKPIQAARWDDWKAVRNGINEPVEIYDLSKDAGEMNDLAGDRPDLVAKAITIFEEAHRVDPEWPLAGPTEAQKEMSKVAWKIKRERDKTAWVPPNAEPFKGN